MARRGENIYKRKDGRYEGRFIKGHRQDGKPWFGYVYGYTYADVKTKLVLAKASAGKQAANIIVIGDGSLTAFLSYWLDNIVRDKVKTSTYARYLERIQGYILPQLGQHTVSKLTLEPIQSFIDNLIQRGLAPSTVNGIAGLLISALKKAKAMYLTLIDPCEGVRLPKAVTEKPLALTRQEQTELELQASKADSGTELGILLSLYTGLRIGEVCALRWKDIDLDSGTLMVNGTLQRISNLSGTESKTILSRNPPKSKSSQRLIPIPEDLQKRLSLYKGSGYILTGTDTPVEPRTLRARFRDVADGAGIDVSFHTLRHTYATRCLEHSFDIQTLSELLGHSSAGITMKVYAHSLMEHKRLLTGRIRMLSETIAPSNQPSGSSALMGKRLKM